MIIYKTIPRYCQETGSKLANTLAIDFHICDFCGNKLETSYISYTIKESNDIEASFDQDRITVSDKIIDIYDFMNNQPEYRYCEIWEYTCETEVIKIGTNSISRMLQQSRYNLVQKLVNDKIYTTEQLGIKLLGRNT